MIVNGYKIEPNANLFGVNLSNANLSDADLSYADLSYAKLYSADLYRANLSNAKLPYANLSDADLSYADLSDAKLMGANLVGANLSGANLSGAIGIVQLNTTQRMLYANMRQDEDGEWYCHIYNGCWNDGRGGTIDQLEEAVTQEYGDDSHYHVLEIPYLRAWEKLELKRLQEIE